MNDGNPLSPNMHRTMARSVLPTRSDTPICCGVLVAANVWIIPVSERLNSLVLFSQQVDGGSLSVLVGYLADVLVTAYGHWHEEPHQVPVTQLEKSVDLVLGWLGMSKLLSFFHSANVAIRNRPLECDISTVSLA